MNNSTRYLFDDDFLELLSYDRFLQVVKLFMSQFGILINLCHFFVLRRKELRSDVFISFLRSIAISDFMTLLMIFITSVWRSFELRRTGYCWLYQSYKAVLFCAVANCLIESSLLTTSWMIVLMSLFQKLVLSKSNNRLTRMSINNSIVMRIFILTGTISSLACFLNFYSIAKISQKSESSDCYHYSSVETLENDKDQFTLADDTSIDRRAASSAKIIYLSLLVIPNISQFVFLIILIRDMIKLKQLGEVDKKIKTTRVIVIILLSSCLLNVATIIQKLLAISEIKLNNGVEEQHVLITYVHIKTLNN